MKKIIALVLVLVMALALCACGGTAPAAPSAPAAPAENNSSAPAAPAEGGDQSDFVHVDIDYATFLTGTNPAQIIIDTLQAKCDELMPGMVTITTYDNGTLLGVFDIHDGVANGTAQMGIIQPGLAPTRYPVSMLMEYPGIAYNSSEVACRVWTDFLRSHDLPEYSDVKVLFGYGAGPGAIFSNKPYTSIADFSGEQIRAAGISAQEVAAFGATPVTMEFSEVYEALRSGLVDGCFTNFGAGGVTKFQEIISDCLMTPLYNSVYTYVLNMDTWNSMPAAQQELFMQAVDMMLEEYGFVYGDAGYHNLQVNRDCYEAINVTWHEGQFLQDCIDAVAPLMDEYAEANGVAEYIPEIQALADKYNADFTMDDFKALFTWDD